MLYPDQMRPQVWYTAELNPNYWDCECEDGYIKPSSVGECLDCGALRDESPDSHAREVIILLEEER